jgi:uncharacterized SAM-binding protein YcdF (DUF218 family)
MSTAPYILKRLLVSIVVLISTILLCFSILSLQIYHYSKSDDLPKADAAVVLGASIIGDKPTEVFKERVDHAINLLNSGHVQSIIFTGGQPEGFEYPEAEVAKKYALKKGVAEEKILIETKSHTTFQNLYYVKEVMNSKGLKTCVIVTDPYHLWRAMKIADDLSLKAYPSATPTSKINNFSFLLGETWRSLRYITRHLLNKNAIEEEMSIKKH